MKNVDDEQTVEVFMWRRKGEEAFNYKLKCPYCEEEQESSIVFNLRIPCGLPQGSRSSGWYMDIDTLRLAAGFFIKRPYRLWCSNCGKSILIGNISKK